jgi:hypothetical protein
MHAATPSFKIVGGVIEGRFEDDDGDNNSSSSNSDREYDFFWLEFNDGFKVRKLPLPCAMVATENEKKTTTIMVSAGVFQSSNDVSHTAATTTTSSSSARANDLSYFRPYAPLVTTV